MDETMGSGADDKKGSEMMKLYTVLKNVKTALIHTGKEMLEQLNLLHRALRERDEALRERDEALQQNLDVWKKLAAEMEQHFQAILARDRADQTLFEANRALFEAKQALEKARWELNVAQRERDEARKELYEAKRQLDPDPEDYDEDEDDLLDF